MAGDRLDALWRIEMYAATEGLDATCACGAELHGRASEHRDGDSTYSNNLLTLVERALEHAKTCKRTEVTRG